MSLPQRLEEYDEIWCVDTEFHAPDGERPAPICLVAQEVRSGRMVRVWEDELRRLRAAPFAVDRHSLFCAYYASAELGCFLALGWPLPVCILDLYVEFRAHTNGLKPRHGNGLLGALLYFGVDGNSAIEKDEMRDLAKRGGPWTAAEQQALLAYCETDVHALICLLAAMRLQIDLPHALLRGRYMRAAARMEHVGIPVDAARLQWLRQHWTEIQAQLITRIDAAYGMYEGRIFKRERFEHWLATQGIPWPRLPSGVVALDDETFKEMARCYPVLHPLRELRASLSQLRLNDLAVGRDGRNRTLLSAFRAKTGRNQPSSTKFVFGPAVWLRHLIQPEPGYGLAYCDWAQQEFGIAGVLSGDAAMLAAYQSEDPYLAFAKQAGAVPPHGTRATHGAAREQFKACVLAVQYGMGAESLAVRIGQPVWAARALLQAHRDTYPTFWRWSDSVVDYAMFHNRLWTVFGWPLHLGAFPNPRSLRNYPMQGNGAEILRLACCFATERGIRVCGPVHDALLIEAPLDALNQVVHETQQAMAEASKIVLDGLALRSDAKMVRYPAAYHDERGRQMWGVIETLHAQLALEEKLVVA